MEGSVENVAREGKKKGERDGNVVDMYDGSNEVEKGYVLAISGAGVCNELRTILKTQGTYTYP